MTKLQWARTAWNLFRLARLTTTSSRTHRAPGTIARPWITYHEGRTIVAVWNLPLPTTWPAVIEEDDHSFTQLNPPEDTLRQALSSLGTNRERIVLIAPREFSRDGSPTSSAITTSAQSAVLTRLGAKHRLALYVGSAP